VPIVAAPIVQARIVAALPAPVPGLPIVPVPGLPIGRTPIA